MTTGPAHCACPGEGKKVIEVKNLRVNLGGQPILKGVTFDVLHGQLVAIIGPNGSGKTTLLRTLLGLQSYHEGEIAIFGGASVREALPRIGYVPQRFQPDRSFVLSVREFLCLRAGPTRHWFWKRHRTVDQFLLSVAGEMKIEELLSRPVASLSGGQLQRVLIAFSLLHRPELLLLDEPTAGVDPSGEQTFYELIAEIQKRHHLTVVLVSHDLSMVYRHASQVFALNGVICCQGTPEEVMNAESLKQAYGIHVTPYHHHHHEGHPHHHVH